MIPYEFHFEAEEELAETAVFYESRVIGLGVAFASEVQRTVNLIPEYPDSGLRLGQKVRRVMVRRFPYEAIYRHDTNRLFILAIAHQHRRPGYWRHRR